MCTKDGYLICDNLLIYYILCFGYDMKILRKTFAKYLNTGLPYTYNGFIFKP